MSDNPLFPVLSTARYLLRCGISLNPARMAAWLSLAWFLAFTSVVVGPVISGQALTQVIIGGEPADDNPRGGFSSQGFVQTPFARQ